MIYVMVTNWAGHWDKIKNNTTTYSKFMLKSGVDPANLVENTRTIFIKLHNVTKKVEKAWEGTTSNFRNSGDKIEFTLSINREIECPAEYTRYTEGWYGCPEKQPFESNSTPKPSDKLIPAFMSRLATTDNWEIFENDSFILLKCLGINDIHKFNQNDQRGKADGFFTFCGMSVLYDCTLDSKFKESKKTQISNFCDQLKKDKIEIKSKKYTIGQHKRAVWIITQCQATNLIEDIDGIKIKEVSVNDLINLYVRRITTELNSEALEEAFIKLGQG